MIAKPPILGVLSRFHNGSKKDALSHALCIFVK